MLAQSLAVEAVRGSGSVWQRGKPIVIRGEAAPNTTVTLASGALFGAVATQSDAAGSWSLSLPAKPAGGPYAFTLRTEAETLELRDVYLGDVLLCAGQSNMEWTVRNSNAFEEVRGRRDPLLRHFKTPKVAETAPQGILLDGAWQAAAPGTLGDFSAVAYYAGAELRARDPNVAIGLLNVSWGGSRIEAWTPMPAGQVAAGNPVSAEERAHYATLQQRYAAAFAGTAARPTPGASLPLAGRTIGEFELGAPWEARGLDDVDGVIWYRASTPLPADFAAAEATLVLGTIDDSDSTWVNGVFVGAMRNAHAETRSYYVPATALSGKTLTVDVRVEDNGGGGGITAPTDSVYLRTRAGRMGLGRTAEWTLYPQSLTIDSTGQPYSQPALLYNGMLAPLTHVQVAAVVWYQGESNAGSVEEATRYRGQLADYIGRRRAERADARLPFVVVELPEFGAPAPAAAGYDATAVWPHLRTAQRAISDVGAAESISTIGLGVADDIHPRDKRPVGQRVSYALRRLLYGDAAAPATPTLREMRATLGAMQLDFEGVGEGLQAADPNRIEGFAVQADSGEWQAVTGAINGVGTVRLVLPAGLKPRAVAYGWANAPQNLSLANAAGVPVSSFQRSLYE